MAGSISDQTTHLSNLSVPGTLSVGTIVGSPAFTAGAITGSTLSLTGGASIATGSVVAGFSSATAGFTSGISVGSAQLITRISKGTISVVTMVCTANGSTTTSASVAPLTTADVIVVNVASSLASGVGLEACVSGNSTVQLIFSNCSTAAQTVAGPFTVSYIAFRS